MSAAKGSDAAASKTNYFGQLAPEDKETVDLAVTDLVREADGHLHVVAQKPGMVTPDEVLHRLTYWLSCYPVGRILVSGIDEFDSLYPRLGESKLFFPAFLELCEAHLATTLFTIAANASAHGLRSLAATVVAVTSRDPATGRLGSQATELDSGAKRSEKGLGRTHEMYLKAQKLVRGGMPGELHLTFERSSDDIVWRIKD